MNSNFVLNDYRYDAVQALRFFAAILVVLTHSFFYASERMGAGYFEWGNGARGVDIFFVISGFVMIIASRGLIDDPLGWAKFAVQRLIRIVPLYWIVTSIKVAVMFASVGMVLHAKFDFVDTLLSYFFIPYKKEPGLVEPLVGVGWTLVFEMFFYFLFALALALRVNIYFFIGLVLSVLCVASFFRPKDYPVWMYLANPLVLEFWLGMMVGRLALKERYLSVWVALLIAVGSLFLILFVNFDLPRLVSTGVPSFLLVYSVVSLEPVLRDKVGRKVLLLGGASYSLYLFHPLVAPIVPELLKKMAINNFAISVLSSVFISIFVSLVVYNLIELPIACRLKRVSFISRFTQRGALTKRVSPSA